MHSSVDDAWLGWTEALKEMNLSDKFEVYVPCGLILFQFSTIY